MFDQYPTSFPRESQPAFDLVTGTWFRNFLKSPEFELLEEEDRAYAENILTDMTGFLLYYQDCLPLEWTADRIEHCLLIDFPRSLFRDGEYSYAVPEVLTLFFRYLKRSRLLPKSSDIADKIDGIRYEYYDEMDNPDNYGMRKGLLISAEGEGIDTDDHDAVLAYLEKIGQREMDGVNPEVTDTLYRILSTWVIPFSDSRYLPVINPASGSEIIEIITTLAGFLIEKRMDPSEWEASDVVCVIEESLIPHPMTKKKKELCIPIIHAFFTFLAGEGLHPHARDIADAVLPLHDLVISESSSEIMGRISEILLKHLIQADVDIGDDAAVDAYVKGHEHEIVFDLLFSENPELMKAMAKSVKMDKNPDIPPAIRPVDITSIPKARRERYGSIIALTDRFCLERLDEEYEMICRNVAARLARKKDCPMLRGKSTIWAAGIVYAVGQINFLFDSSFKPYQSADDICTFFDTKKSTTSQKAKMIRDSIGMNDYWDPEFSTSKILNSGPNKILW